MSTTFIHNHDKLLALLPSNPTKDEMECLLRITPQGMSKINADMIRGTSCKIIILELVEALRSINKLLNRTYNELELLPDRKTTIEENEALEWAIQSHPTVLNTMIQQRDITDVLSELIWDFRINKLSLESERLRRHGNPVYISPLVATTFVDTTDYIALRTIQLSNRQHVCLNPIYLWFDFEISIQPSHFRLCTLPSLFAEDIASSPACSSTSNAEHSSFCTEDEGRCSIGVPRKSFHVRFVEGICPSPKSGLRRNGVSEECPSNDLPVLTGSIQAEVFAGSISLSSLSSEVSPKHKVSLLSKINHWFTTKKKKKKI